MQAKIKVASSWDDSGRAMLVLAASLAVGGAIILLYASQAPNWAECGSIVSVSLLVASAALVSGCLLGFLFGIPRTLQQDGKPLSHAEGATRDGGSTSKGSMGYGVNTNLEQISDWLTKILVGVGLTQISALPSALKKYAEFVGTGVGDYPQSKVFAVALLIFFVINGFLIGYLWTRLYLAGALIRADAASRLDAVETKLDSIDLDAKAWSLAQRMLDPASGISVPSQAEINSTIAAATDNMKAQIFWTARTVRHENWQALPNKPRMERTIPIFRALIASDIEGVYHANHGQLGYALKDQRTPDWAQAEAELTQAIRLRGDWRTSDWRPFYEFVRAQCYIARDEAFKAGRLSDESTRDKIQADLKVALSESTTRKAVQEDADVERWMKINGFQG